VLKGIDPILTPELLKVMAEMGHDDSLVVADANFTAMSLGAGKPVIRLPGVGLLRVVQAVTSLLPLGEVNPHPVACMQVGGTQAPYLSALQREVQSQLAVWSGRPLRLEMVDRYAFYDRATLAHAIVVTGEQQPWGNLILHKGFLGEALRP
jgi:L-fucose mutarotase